MKTLNLIETALRSACALALVAAVCVPLTGCEDGVAEDAGEAIDDAADEVGDAIEDVVD